MASTGTIFDMSLFSNFQLPRGCCEDIKLCPCIQRLLRALHYYSSSLSKNKEQQNEFINLINETYKITFIIDDLHHLQEKHSHQLYEIKNHALNNFPFSRCNINTCQFANRHYRVNNNNDSKDLPLLKVNMRIHCDIMDSCHCYVFHLSDIGIRMFGDDQVTDGNDNDSNEESKKNEAYDGKFAQIAKTILPTKDASDRFNRISSGNKYNISTAADDTAEVIEYDGITYLDTIFDYLQQLQIEDDVILEVYQFLKYEKYDTESLDLDIKMNGNISQHMINHNNCTDGIIHVFNQSILSSGTFSIGIDWEYYENKENGLFVEPKYDNLKDEVLQYKYFDIKLYESELLPKADNYRTSTKIKCMKSKYDYKDDYGILQNEVISIDRLMCIILYTDYSNLSSGFTSTFRKNNRFEPLQAIKKRHRNYYWMARLLRETVAVYGQRGHGDFDAETDETINKLSGPFFCGMNAVMNLPQFNIYLLSPTSTTVQITVATKFGGYSGIIIEFGNDRGNAEYVPGLDVSFISRFHEEDERLFYGYRDEGLNIISIRIIENHLNLKTTISAITALDNILTNNVDDHHKISGDQSYGRIISHLFDYALTDNPSNQQFPMHPYIYDTFKCFANHKTKIDIQLHNINNYVEDRKLLDLLFHSLVKEEVTSNNEYVEVRNRQNLLKGYLLKIFKNVEEINITASSSVPDYGKFVYPFSILLLLNVIDDTKINKFKINVDRNTDLNVIGWLGSIEKSKLVTSIVRMYKERGYGIKVNKGFFGYLDLVITKKSVYR